MAELERAGAPQWIRGYGQADSLRHDPWPITAKPENLAIVVAGGTHTTHAYWMQSAFVPRVAKAQIRLPAEWDALLREADHPQAEAEAASGAA